MSLELCTPFIVPFFSAGEPAMLRFKVKLAERFPKLRKTWAAASTGKRSGDEAPAFAIFTDN
ncbi:hypothetical protein CWR43_19225 [Rhizobium sullae]|uniref:Uncharacterized protein n=1 Tax=Rhizobium sullae TaxID=50338 RepID=A0A2N0D800_RHISU|nr:hypothetical protein CWR43_19225 [Rhizobium sullae]